MVEGEQRHTLELLENALSFEMGKLLLTIDSTDIDPALPIAIVGKQLLWSVDGILQIFGKFGTEKGREQCQAVGGKGLEVGSAVSPGREISVQTGANGSQLSRQPFADSD